MRQLTVAVTRQAARLAFSPRAVNALLVRRVTHCDGRRHLSIWGWRSTSQDVHKGPRAGSSQPAELSHAIPGSQASDADSTPSSGVPNASTTSPESVVPTLTDQPLKSIGLVQDPAPICTEAQPLIESITRIGDLKALGLCNFTPVGGFQAIMELIYVTTGLSWATTILLATVAIRLSLIPMVVITTRTATKLQRLSPRLTALRKQADVAKASRDHASLQASQLQQKKLLEEEGVNPLQSLILQGVQIPVFLSAVFALGRMADLPVPGFERGGLLWFTDLTRPDPYCALPLLAFASMITSMEVAVETGGAAQTPLQSIMRNVFRVMMIPFAYAMSSYPSALSLYWTCANVLSLVQSATLRNATVRKALKIPLQEVSHSQMYIRQRIGIFESLRQYRFFKAKTLQ